MLEIVKALVAVGSLFPDCVTLHSYGEKRPTKKRTKLTAMKPTTIHSHTYMSSGSMKEKTPGFWRSGFLIMMEMPVFMKGLVKSTTLSRLSVMLRGATAMSLSCSRTFDVTAWCMSSYLVTVITKLVSVCKVALNYLLLL